MNYFILSVIILFMGGAIAEGVAKNYSKALFYLLSGLINIVAMYMK